MTTLSLLALTLVACGTSATATPAPVPEPTSPPPPTATFAPPPAAATPTAFATPTPAPVTKAKVSRLIAAQLPPSPETTDPSLAANFHQFQWLPHGDFLVQFGHKNGVIEGRLAEGWELSPDGKTWTFPLRDDATFHFDFGSFTSTDVEASLNHYLRAESEIARVNHMKDRFGIPREIQPPIPPGVVDTSDPHQVVFNLAQPDAEFFYEMSDRWANIMLSKQQMESAPYDEWVRKVAGTGSYQFVETQLGNYTLWENAPGTHYFKEPAFEELQIFYVLEPSTRLAMLLGGQAHIVELPTELSQEARNRGMEVALTTLGASVVFGVMGGQFDTGLDQYDPDVVWLNKDVRQALNMAIDRDELVTELWGGVAEKIIGPPMWYPRNAGWNPQWEQDFKEMYRYDPEEAKSLLAAAGYPNGFTVKWKAFARPGIPWRELVEATIGYMDAIGVKLEVEELEYSTFRGHFRQFDHTGWGFWWTAQENTPATRSSFHHNLNRNQQQWYVSPTFQSSLEELVVTMDAAKREELLQDMGDELFYEYALIPLVAVRVQYAYNPDVVSEFLTTGLNGIRDLEFVVPAQ